MADLTRAEELVQTIEQDATLREAIQAAPTATAKRAVLDTNGFQDIDLDDMKAYVESKGGTLVVPPAGHELSEQELAAVSGGITDEEAILIGIGVPLYVGIAAGAAAA